MPIGQINYAMIQRTTDVEAFKHQEEAKPMVDQQNIQTVVKKHEEALRHQVIKKDDSNRAENHADAKEEGKGKYTASQGKKKAKLKNDSGQVIKKTNQGFDIKI